MPTATLTSKGQITLPKEIRDRLRLGKGDQVDFVLEDDGRVVLRPTATDLRELRGMLRAPKSPTTVEAMDEAIGVLLADKHRAANRRRR